MIDLRDIKEMTIEAYVFGGEITRTINAAIGLAAQIGCHYDSEPNKGGTIKFNFNAIMVSVRMDSDPELIYRDWRRAMSGYINREVGPYPNPILTDDETRNDARIEAKNEQRRQQQRAEWQAEADAKRNATEAKLADAPEMEITDQTSWQSWKDNNQDQYGGSVIAYAERWARLMQMEINTGKKLEDIADTASDEADINGITGFMYSYAVRVLVTTWRYGDQLREWHNKQR